MSDYFLDLAALSDICVIVHFLRTDFCFKASIAVDSRRSQSRMLQSRGSTFSRMHSNDCTPFRAVSGINAAYLWSSLPIHKQGKQGPLIKFLLWYLGGEGQVLPPIADCYPWCMMQLCSRSPPLKIRLGKTCSGADATANTTHKAPYYETISI